MSPRKERVRFGLKTAAGVVVAALLWVTVFSRTLINVETAKITWLISLAVFAAVCVYHLFISPPDPDDERDWKGKVCLMFATPFFCHALINVPIPSVLHAAFAVDGQTTVTVESIVDRRSCRNGFRTVEYAPFTGTVCDLDTGDHAQLRQGDRVTLLGTRSPVGFRPTAYRVHARRPSSEAAVRQPPANAAPLP